MLFKKKYYLRNQEDKKLLVRTEELKQEWINLKRINDKSFSYLPQLDVEGKIAEQKYLILFREIKYRKTRK